MQTIEKEYIKESFENNGLQITEKQIDQFILYYELLIEWNQVMNLTAITEFKDVIVKHFLDSVILGKKIDLTKDTSLIDVGTGAGFPGLPLKIMYPNLKLTLLDSLNKRILFLQTVAKKLELENITFIHGRAEDFGQNPNFREQYDLAVSRAVANLSTLAEYCVPFVKPNGYFVSYKSDKSDEEIDTAKGAIKKLHSELEKTIKLDIKGTELTRSFVIIRKKGLLDKKYPRKAGTPTKNPLQ